MLVTMKIAAVVSNIFLTYNCYVNYHDSKFTYLDNKLMASSMANFTFTFATFYCDNKVGQESSGSIATCYGLGGLGIQSCWGQDFPHPSRPLLGPTQPPIQWASGFSWG
jgi:hypothetical protein